LFLAISGTKRRIKRKEQSPKGEELSGTTKRTQRKTHRRGGDRCEQHQP